MCTYTSKNKLSIDMFTIYLGRKYVRTLKLF